VAVEASGYAVCPKYSCIAVLDTVMIGLSISLALALRWPVALAVVASTLRITYGVRNVARVCAG
jgi:hypothetical protein